MESVNTTPLETAFIEIRGREGSQVVYQKPVNAAEDVTDAEEQILKSIACRLPAFAFDAFFHEETTDLHLNDDGKMFLYRLGERGRHIGWMSRADATEFIWKIAGYNQKVITSDNPRIECVFPLDNSRFTAQLPPIVAGPVFTIRRRAVRVFTLEDYVDAKIMTSAQCDTIKRVVQNRENVLVIGGTGSGKTTLLNAVLNEITLSDPYARQIIIEDCPELKSTAENRVYYSTSETVKLTDLVETTLRMSPDRIIVGECRNSSAFDLIDSWNTGHPGGASSIHANSCISGLRRLKNLISRYPEIHEETEPDIALAVNVMVNLVKTGDSSRVLREIVAIRDYDPTHPKNGGYCLDVL